MFDDCFTSILKTIFISGVTKHNRTGIDTKSVFNTIIRCDKDSEGNNIPLTSLRKVYFKGALIETLWILGLHMNDERYSHLPQTNTKYLEDHNVKYWRPWQDEFGNLGPVYGSQLVSWKSVEFPKFIMDESDIHPKVTTINQIQNIIDKLRTNPDDRRLVCTMWNPGELDKMALPPCHYAMEFYSRPLEDGRRALDIRWIQRSADLIIGIPYDVIIYTMINKIVAMCTGHVPGHVIGILGDTHLYKNQEEAGYELIKRSFKRWKFQSLTLPEEVKKYCTQPYLEISERIQNIIKEKGMCELSDFAIDGSDFKLCNYNPFDKIDIPVAV